MDKFDFITEDLFAPEGAVGNKEGAQIVPITLKIRHTPEFVRATIHRLDEGYHIVSETPIQGIAPGQYAVIYDTESRLCFGSGMIVKGK